MIVPVWLQISVVIIAGQVVWSKKMPVTAEDFTYTGELGVENWPRLFPQCGGSRQSPVDLRSSRWVSFRSLWFESYYERPLSMTIENNGNSAQVSIEAQDAPSISGGGLNGTYKFEQLHFHWGSNNFQGSEHTINGVRYPLEMHMVHYDDSFDSMAEAVGAGSPKRPTLAILSVLFKVSHKDNPAFTPIIQALKRIRYEGDSTSVYPAYPLAVFLPFNVCEFFRYQGSLTTPTCDEIVTWTVFKRQFYISFRQLKRFRQLFNDEDEPLVDNFRPTQNLNGRKVLSVNTCARHFL